MRASPSPRTLAALAALLVASPAGAQYARRPPVERTVPVRVALTIAGQPAESRGVGICYHRPDFALHGKPARQWSVSYSSAAGGNPVAVVLSLAVPQGSTSGPFAATLTANRKPRRIGVGTPRPRGSGTVTPTAEGAGWRFAFDARAADGAEVKGTVTCERTSPLGGG